MRVLVYLKSNAIGKNDRKMQLRDLVKHVGYNNSYNHVIKSNGYNIIIAFFF